MREAGSLRKSGRRPQLGNGSLLIASFFTAEPQEKSRSGGKLTADKGTAVRCD